MSIIVPDEDIYVEVSYSNHNEPSSSLKGLQREAHINSRNLRRNSLSNSTSQYSTKDKEGTPNKAEEGKVESKTMEIRNINKELEKASSASVSSKDKLSNITQILNQNNYNYSNVKDKIPSTQGDSNQFVYNMIYTTNTIRTETITKRLNDLKKTTQMEIEKEAPRERETKCVPKKQSINKQHSKEKISCCFFFHK